MPVRQTYLCLLILGTAFWGISFAFTKVGVADGSPPKAYYLREIIDHGLTDLENYYLAAEVLEHVRKNKRPFTQLRPKG